MSYTYSYGDQHKYNKKYQSIYTSKLMLVGIKAGTYEKDTGGVFSAKGFVVSTMMLLKSSITPELQRK